MKVNVTPKFIFDSHEKWFPMPVEALTLVGAKVKGVNIVDVNLLDKGNGDLRIDFPRDMKPQELVKPVGYHRVMHAGNLYWHQYWLFYLYNPKKYVGFGEHEGDWEMVQIGCIDEEGDKPVLMTCSQHSGGERREYWRVQLDSYYNILPLVYVARDSHANYFNQHNDVSDVADGSGQIIMPEWREFGPWQNWMGKWGNSDNSPGPLTTRRAWTAPHAYHSQARG